MTQASHKATPLLRAARLGSVSAATAVIASEIRISRPYTHGHVASPFYSQSATHAPSVYAYCAVVIIARFS